jgi:hypothetical protein
MDSLSLMIGLVSLIGFGATWLGLTSSGYYYKAETGSETAVTSCKTGS